jgi:hypothetical protein
VAAVDEALGDEDASEIEPELAFLGRIHFRETVHRSYPPIDSPVEVFVGSADLRDRRTSPISSIHGLPGSGWLVRLSHSGRIGPSGPEIVSQIVEKGTRRRLSYYWFAGSLGLRTETLRSFLGLERSEFHRLQGQLVVRLSTPLESTDGSGLEAARLRLESIHRRLEPALAAALMPPAYEPPSSGS